MVNSILERQIESAVQEAVGEKGIQAIRKVGKIAAMQGGESTVANFQLLGKRVLIALGITLVAVQATTSVVGLVLSRRSEKKRVERIVRQVLEEERQEQGVVIE